MKHMYVDNLLTSVNSSKLAKEFYSESKEVFQESSMNLQEWGSNSKEFLKSIPEQDRVKQTITKVLGILWNTVADRLAVKRSKPTEYSSKREVLKSIATVFDPLGFFTPATLGNYIQTSADDVPLGQLSSPDDVIISQLEAISR